MPVSNDNTTTASGAQALKDAACVMSSAGNRETGRVRSSQGWPWPRVSVSMMLDPYAPPMKARSVSAPAVVKNQPKPQQLTATVTQNKARKDVLPDL